MNYSMIKHTLGWLLIFEAGFFAVPLITAAVFWESAFFSFLIAALISGGLGFLLTRRKPRDTSLYAKEGFVIVALSWLVMSLFGALPFLFSGVTGSFIDAFFETVSGFTTTGASIFTEVEWLPKSVIMWRSFTHWIGGMGVLVFIMAFLPLSGGQNMHIMRAESPGPEVSKLVPRVKNTAVILYILYFVMTFIMFISLLFAEMNVFEALNTAFATAGTGGFGFKNDSFASASIPQQIIVTVFMLLFSINFNSYYLILKTKFKDAINSEIKAFVFIVVVAVTIITLNTMGTVDSILTALRNAAFTVASLISTTGFTTANFSAWPALSQTVLVGVMFIGACAGSTGGGIKVSRIIILFKGMARELRTLTHPKQIKKITIDKKPVEHEVVRSVNAYIVTFILVFAAALMLISFDNKDLVTSFTAVAATLNNIGPGLGEAYASYAAFSPFSKVVLSFTMIIGRLELFPMLILFSPSTWRKKG